jgi:DNA-binding NarL/FixJ family response regulator
MRNRVSMFRRVLIVDDHRQVRAAMRGALEADGWNVVGEAATGHSALTVLEDSDADVVLLDVGLPDISGLQVARKITGDHPNVAVVMTSTHDRADYRDLALKCGARGFVPKSSLSGSALEAILGS